MTHKEVGGGGALAAGVGVSAVRVTWFRFWFLGSWVRFPGSEHFTFGAPRAREHSTSGVLLFPSKAIDGDMPSGRGESPEQQFRRLGALSARALYPAAASQIST